MSVLIGIPQPTSADLSYNDQCWPEYARAVQNLGATPVMLPVNTPAAEVRKLVLRCDGFVLPGSPADVDPTWYGQARLERTAPADAARDSCDRAVLEHAAEQGKPVLAVCYGLQHLNVWCGGTLIEDLAPLPVPHAAGPSVAVAHTVQVTAQSLLASLLGAAEAPLEGHFRKLPVNSSHHQAIAIVGEGLTVVARCGQDGVIEAVEGRLDHAAIVGVQWHPERSVEISPASRSLFLWLLSEAEDGQMLRITER